MGRDRKQPNTKGIYGLILAAGYSSRMGAFKPLLPIGDMTAIERVIKTLEDANVNNIVAVTGYQRDLLSPILKKRKVREAYNSDYDLGMFTSIKAGIGQALSGIRDEDGGFFLMLVDCPLVSPEVLELILKKHEEIPDAFIVPCFCGKKGHPLFIPTIYADEILAYDGEGGLKAITNRHEEHLIRLDVQDEAVVLDMDTQDGYREIRDYYDRQRKGRNVIKNSSQWQELLNGRRLFLVRHGQTEQHKEKIFLGQTDVPLSDLGKDQSKQAGWQLKDYSAATDRIYTSDLCRASETAEIIAGVLSNRKDRKIYCFKDKGLREMSLGEWDGKYISWVKEHFPEEYKRRGENLLTYKYGNDSENYYDLQYRVLKSFEGILRLEVHETKLLKEREDGRYLKDIVIVAHTGVIKVILSNLYGRDLSEEVNRTIPNGGITLIDLSEI